jgi:type I restriction enzyme M protein
MLDTDTKRRIDTARDLLVGKVPDPKSQVEQITIALIYKFMDDMDAEAEELGGKRKFFSGEYGKFGWAKLMQPGIGGHELLALYADGIAKMPENPGIPALFRDIFKNAYLPYRDPETLKSFLKVINEFSYDHSERLGDAFEYLLSVLGSQGDAGQFRTPRHIIDFIVEILAPRKEEVLLDPSCGTAGFLISAYKHILRSNTDAKGHNTLTPQQRGEMAKNFKGYDISPDMVRLSLVNLYLHGFTDPHIFEYDTLTDTARWNEFADVILANPPFMSPKGGIRPHNRFSIQAKRSEVLFVDYIAEHLTPNGRAGIIVPEGIIFQSQNAYKDLRRMLVENSLVAVISLPAGCFNPYSGVKTSILLLDKSLARKSDTIAFFKVENDGYDLGAQRRPIQKNDLPKVHAELESYLATLRERKDPSDLTLTTALIISKEKIAANGDYNLSGERYRESDKVNQKWPMVELGTVARLINGRAYKQEELLTEGPTPVLRVGNFFSNRGWYYSDLDLEPDKYCEAGDLLFAWSASFGPRIWDGPRAIYHYHIWKIEPKEAIEKMFLFHLLAADAEKIKSEGNGIAMVHATKGGMEKRKFPLPPLEIQREIVAEIEGYQKVITGARAVLDNYRPHIPINPDWPNVAIGDVAESTLLGLVRNKAEQDPKFAHPYIKMNNISVGGSLDLSDLAYVNASPEEIQKLSLQDGDFIYNTRNAPDLVGKSAVFHGENGKYLFNNNILRIRFGTPALPDFVNTVMNSDLGKAKIRAQVDGTTSVAALYQKNYLAIEIPLPPLAEQQAIVAEIEAEQALVNANRELITRFETKIQTTLSRIWGDPN